LGLKNGGKQKNIHMSQMEQKKTLEKRVEINEQWIVKVVHPR
jgi:hypothetical protein